MGIIRLVSIPEPSFALVKPLLFIALLFRFESLSAKINMTVMENAPGFSVIYYRSKIRFFHFSGFTHGFTRVLRF